MSKGGKGVIIRNRIDRRRQIGKTETIRRFADKNYKYVNEINFVTDPMYKSIVEEGFSAASIVKIISRIDPGKKFEEGETLLFFDEIQEFPEIATSLKFFKEDGKYDVICSGSLLGVQYHRIASISVGAKTDYPMHSMDFEEFLWAKGYGDDLIEDMINHMIEGSPFPEAEHKTLSNLFLEFCILGGMPAVISNYIEKGTFEGSLDIQRQLLVDYSNDIVKYAEGLDKAKILSVFNSIPLTSFVRLGMIWGSKLPSRSRGVRISISPMLDFTVFSVYPLRQLSLLFSPRSFGS